jgi:hypothetical protein
LDLKLSDTIVESDEPVVIAIDSSGIKVTNRGEWMREVWKVHRGWIKVHIAVNVKTKEVVGHVLSIISLELDAILFSIIQLFKKPIIEPPASIQILGQLPLNDIAREYGILVADHHTNANMHT